MNSFFVSIIVIYLAVNIYPTIQVLKYSEQKNTVKLFQFIAIWCIPFLGGLTISLVYMIHPAHGSGPYDVGLTEHSDGDGGE